MKLISTIKQTRALEFYKPEYSGSCSLVGNSGILLKEHFGSLIDSSDMTIRFNGAKIKGFQKNVGTKTNIRILNCHYIKNIDSISYYNHQKSRFPEMDRFFLYNLEGEDLIFKTDPSWKLWEKKEIIKNVERKNNVYFISEEFYNLGKKINDGKEATNGFIGLMLSIKYFTDVRCFGFSFYEDQGKKHYYEKINCNPKNNHNFDKEKKVFSLLSDNKIIQFIKKLDK